MLPLAVVLPAAAEEMACRDTPPVAAVDCSSLAETNASLQKKVKLLESERGITSARLRQKKAERLKTVAAGIRAQRQGMGEFEGFVTWMSTNLAGYNKYIQAGSYAAVVGKMLPIPYAGQASVFTKFIAQFTVSLNDSSTSINRYLASSKRFLTLADAIDPKQPDEARMAEAALLVEREVLRDMLDVQQKLGSLSELSNGALSFLQTLSHYVSGSDEYWNRVKGLVKKDLDPKEKSFISESTSSLKNQADRFNSRLSGFGETTRREGAAIKSLALYDELLAEPAPEHK